MRKIRHKVRSEGEPSMWRQASEFCGSRLKSVALKRLPCAFLFRVKAILLNNMEVRTLGAILGLTALMLLKLTLDSENPETLPLFSRPVRAGQRLTAPTKIPARSMASIPGPSPSTSKTVSDFPSADTSLREGGRLQVMRSVPDVSVFNDPARLLKKQSCLGHPDHGSRKAALEAMMTTDPAKAAAALEEALKKPQSKAGVQGCH